MMEQNLFIRRAAVTDAELLAETRRSAWDATYRGIYPDAWIDEYDLAEQTQRERARLEQTDYMAYLMQSEDAPDTITAVPRMQHQELIDEFIGQGDKRIVLNQDADSELQTPALPAEGENEEDEDYFTETLAKIYIKQGRYTKAMEIIRRLSLKYPKKNRYFADQIRFLEKLIINNKNKKS